jgi:hypothetical protein
MDRAVIVPGHPPARVTSVSEAVAHARPENLYHAEHDDPLQSYEIR